MRTASLTLIAILLMAGLLPAVPSRGGGGVCGANIVCMYCVATDSDLWCCDDYGPPPRPSEPDEEYGLSPIQT